MGIDIESSTTCISCWVPFIIYALISILLITSIELDMRVDNSNDLRIVGILMASATIAMLFGIIVMVLLV